MNANASPGCTQQLKQTLSVDQMCHIRDNIKSTQDKGVLFTQCVKGVENLGSKPINTYG